MPVFGTSVSYRMVWAKNCNLLHLSGFSRAYRALPCRASMRVKPGAYVPTHKAIRTPAYISFISWRCPREYATHARSALRKVQRCKENDEKCAGANEYARCEPCGSLWVCVVAFKWLRIRATNAVILARYYRKPDSVKSISF